MSDFETSSARAPRNPLAVGALALALLGGVLVLFAGPGTRSGWWSFGTGFDLLRYGAYLAIAAAVAALLALALASRWRGRGRVMAAAALLVALPAVLLPWNLRRSARQFPGIHDITTDPANPPALVELAAVREASGATNLTEYEGDSIARIQREAYPDIQPVMLAMHPDSAFAVAFQTARAMGWEVATADPAEGRIEATATTRWFGFKDDVVIRLRRASGITRLDIRSVSRVGRGDAGANAARIREYVRRLPGRVEM
jgi:uncharacterized protein (DUF1499 family)